MIHTELQSIQSYKTYKVSIWFLSFMVAAMLGLFHSATTCASPGTVKTWKILEDPPVCSDTNGMRTPDEYVAVAIDSQGSVIAVSAYGVIAKYSNNGNRLWKKWLNGQTVIIYACDEGEQWLDYSPSDVLVDDDDYIYVLGVKRHAPSDYYVNRIFLMKLTPSGSLLWTKEIANYDKGADYVFVHSTVRPKMRLWHPDIGGTYIVIGSGLYGRSGFLCYDLSGNLVWHKNDGEPTGPFDLDGQRLFKAHLVEQYYPGSDNYIIAPAIDVCPIASFNNAPLSCTTISTAPPPHEGNPQNLGLLGDLLCSSHTGTAQNVFMVSTVLDSSHSYDEAFAFVSLGYNPATNSYQASGSKYFKRGSYLANYGIGLAPGPSGNIWMTGNWWYDPVIVMPIHIEHIYMAMFSPLATILSEYDYGSTKKDHCSECQAMVYEIASDKNGVPVIVGLDHDPATDKDWLFISSNLNNFTDYRNIMPNIQFSIFDPVSPLTGNYVDRVVDLNYPTGGIPLAAIRTYASRFAEDSGRLGYGWHLGILDMHVDGSPGKDDRATIVWGDGHRVDYIVSSSKEEGSTLTFEFTPLGPKDDSITLTALSSDSESYFKVYVKKLDRTIIFAHSEANGEKWYPTTIFKGQNKAAQSAFPLVFTYLQDSIKVTDENSGKNITFTLAAGRVTNFRGSAGESVSYVYDQNGNLSKVTMADGTVVHYSYDSGHHLTSITQAGKTLLENSYDVKGRVIRQVDEAGRGTTFSYDDANQKTTVTGPDGTVTTYFYDNQYRLVRLENQEGLAKTYAYDDRGRLVSVTMPDGSTTTFTYNEAGNLIERTDPFGNKTRYSYDANGRLVASTDPLGNSAGFSYSGAGLLSSWQNPKGGVYAINYNNLGLKASITDPLGHSDTFLYASNGLLSAVTRKDGITLTHERDAAGRVTKTIYGSGQSAVSYTYDALGRVTSVHGPSGTVSYAYNSRGYKASETGIYGQTVTYSYENGHLASVSVGPFTITAQRDAAGRPLRVTDSFGHTLSYSYGQDGRLLSIEGPAGIHAFYTHDASGLVSAISFEDASSSLIRRLVIQREAGGRIVSTSHEGAPEPSLLSETRTYTYNQMDWLTTAQYDPCGRLTGFQGASFQYDIFGRLVGAERGGHTSSFTYDPTGRLASIGEDGLARKITYAGVVPIMETDEEGEPTSYFLFGPGICLVIAPDGTLRYILLSDFRRNIVAVLDGQGQVIGQRLYSPFGLVLGQEGTWPVPFGFLGEAGLYTASTNLVMTRARAYDIETGRFLTPDPVPPSPENPLYLNRYVYAWNDPVNFVDTSGLSPFPLGPIWLIPGWNARITLHPTNTLNGVALPPMNSWGGASAHVADSSPIYSDRYAMTGGGNTQLAPNFTDSAGLMASFYTLASSSG